jgi:hypothetical protein
LSQLSVRQNDLSWQTEKIIPTFGKNGKSRQSGFFHLTGKIKMVK